MRVGRFCHLPEKCELRFIGKFFPIFENISEKPVKFPFHRRITRLCSIHRAKMAFAVFAFGVIHKPRGQIFGYF